MKRIRLFLIGSVWLGAGVTLAENVQQAAASSNETARLARAISANDTNVVAAAIAANQTNLIAAAVAVNETNLVKAVKADEDAGGWESIFSEANRSKVQLRFFVKNGLYYEFRKDTSSDEAVLDRIFSEKRRVTGRLGVKLQLDGGVFEGNGKLPDPGEQTALRRLRLSTYGRTYFISPLTYGVSYGVSDGDYYFSDGYAWFHDIPYVKSLKLGVFTPPMSLANMQSSSTSPMMEIAAPVSAFIPGDRAGVQLGGEGFKGRGTLYGGFFAYSMSDDEGDDSDSYSRFVSRATWLPMFRPETEQLIHLGVSMNYLFAESDGTRYRSRPESYLAPYLVDTGHIDGDNAITVGTEAAWVNGPLSFQGEYFASSVDDTNSLSSVFFGGYVMGSLFLTGESRPYNSGGGTFGTLTPRHNFSFRERRLGAVEWTARASYLDLTDGYIQGGEMAVFSTGLNFYLTKQNRIMLVLGMANVNKEDSDGELYFAQSRFQVEF